MAVYSPPVSYLPIFDEVVFSLSGESLTYSDADARYLRLSGGIETGLVTFNAGLASVGTISSSKTEASTSSTTGAIQSAGGIYAGTASVFNSDLTVNSTGVLYLKNTTPSTSSTTGALQCSGGANFDDDVNFNTSSVLRIRGTTASTAASGSGIVQINGGISVAKNIWTGTDFSASVVTNTGSAFHIPNFTFTNSGTAASGTAANNFIFGVKQCTIGATNSSVTTSHAGSVYIGGAPVKGTNQTFTFASALYIDSAVTTAATVTEAYSLFITGPPTVTSGTTFAIKASSGKVYFGDTTDATSSTDGGALTSSGGCAVAKKLYVGTGILLPTSGGTAGTLNYYEEYTAGATFADTGTWSASVTIRITRVGKTVTFYLPPLIDIALLNSTSITSSAVIPSRFRSANSDNFLLLSQNGGADKIAKLVINTSNGDITISGSPTAFTTGVTLQIYGNGMSWTI